MTLHETLGQEAVIERLRSAHRRRRLAHGYLFVGAGGTGRESVARALAQLFLCQQPVDGDACGTCGACVRVKAGTHPDLQILLSDAEAARRGRAGGESTGKPSEEIRIEAVRELCRQLRMRPYEGVGKVGVLVDAHRLRMEAANALLKMLEEPGDATLLVLIAPSPRAVLDTLRSRCQVVRFSPLPIELIADLLQREQGVDPHVALSAARAADGSIGRAERLASGDAQQGFEVAADYLDAAAGLRLEEILDTAAGFGRDRPQALQLVDGLAHHLHGRIVDASRSGRQGAVDLRGRAFEATQEAERAIHGNASPQLVLEALAATLHPLLCHVAPATAREAGDD